MLRIIITFLSLTLANTAGAIPILAIDLDSTTPGIQSSLTVAPGTPIMGDVVAYDDGSPPSPVSVDFVGLDVFSSLPSVASLAGGPASAGSFVGSFSLPVDLLGGPTAPGATLPPLTAPSPGNLGLVGYFDVLTGIGGILPLGAPSAVDLIHLPTIIAGAPGSSTLSILGFPPGTELIFASMPLTPTLMSGTITVSGPAGAPEPATLLLLGLGLAGLASTRRRKR